MRCRIHQFFVSNPFCCCYPRLTPKIRLKMKPQHTFLTPVSGSITATTIPNFPIERLFTSKKRFGEMQSVSGGASSIESITLSSVMLDDGRTMVRRKETKLRNGRVLIRDSPIFVAPKRLDHNDVSQGNHLQERPETKRCCLWYITIVMIASSP